MYFSARQFPAIKGLSKKEQAKLVKIALRQNDKWIGWRFAIVILILVACAFLISRTEFALRFWNCDWFAIGFGIGFGFLFYLYLLWEINGAVYEAVSKYTSKPT